MNTVKELFQRVCNGETLDEKQLEVLRGEFMFDKPLSVLVVGDNDFVKLINQKLDGMPIQNIKGYTNNAQEEIDILESMCPDIIFVDCSYSIALVCFLRILKSNVLKNKVFALVHCNTYFSIVVYMYDLDVVILSNTLSYEEVSIKLIDMLIYKKCCTLKESGFDYRKCCVLYTDSCESNKSLVKFVLKNYFNIDDNFIFVSSNAEVMEYLKKKTDLLLITDILRGPYNGITFMCIVHRLYKNVPFIFYSACCHLIADAYKVGASEFIGKPFDLYEAVNKIRYQLKRQQCMKIYRQIME